MKETCVIQNNMNGVVGDYLRVPEVEMTCPAPPPKAGIREVLKVVVVSKRLR